MLVVVEKGTMGRAEKGRTGAMLRRRWPSASESPGEQQHCS